MRRAWVGVLALLLALAGCDSGGEIRTVSDFDEHPCALITDAIMTGIVTPALQDLIRAAPTLVRSTENGPACTYLYNVPNSPIPQFRTFSITIEHSQAANQPLAICLGGATARTAGYTKEANIGDAACLSPSADLWMRVGEHYFHVVAVPQPGFADPVDRLQSTAPLLVAVATSAADRLPKS